MGLRKELVLEGLCCPNCAAKIEDEINSIDGVKFATLDFITRKLTIEVYNSRNLRGIIEQASRIAVRIEANIEVLDIEKVKDTSKEKNKFFRPQLLGIIVGAILFFTALIFNLPRWVELVIYLVSYLAVGHEVLIASIKNIARGQVFDENFLMGIASVGAFAIGEFPEGVAVMLFYQIGEFFQEMAVNRSRRSISALMDIRPDYANLKSDDCIEKVSPEDVRIGETIVVKPGEKVPLDGAVIEGNSMLDTSALTGESIPREVEPGVDILSGSINKNGLLTIRVTKEFSESTVSKILNLVQNASSKKAPTENFITKFAKYYTPAVVLVAVASAVIPPLVIPGAAFSTWLNRALVFLVVSCPCALVISIPLSFFGGIGGASRNGILIKGSNYLEALNKVDTVVFDKTGTLTKGIFAVTKVKSFEGFDEADLLKYAAYAESYSSHPIALSILKAFGKEIEKGDIENYNEVSGYGVKASVKGMEILVGNGKLMQTENIQFEETEEFGTKVHIAFNRKYAGYILISDEIKHDAARAVQGLRDTGIKKIIMLTGDSKSVGESIGKQLKFDEVHAELLPDEKVERLELLEKRNSSKGKLVFVGDGINDAPVLAMADIGIAMGGVGSDAAIEAADIVLMTDEPSKVIDAIKIAKKTRNIVMQNIVFALGIKLLVLLLGAGGIATMWEAVFADVGVALIAVLNAMRAMKNKL